MKDSRLRLWPGVAAGALIVIGFAIEILFYLAMPASAPRSTGNSAIIWCPL